MIRRVHTRTIHTRQHRAITPSPKWLNDATTTMQAIDHTRCRCPGILDSRPIPPESPIRSPKTHHVILVQLAVARAGERGRPDEHHRGVSLRQRRLHVANCSGTRRGAEGQRDFAMLAQRQKSPLCGGVGELQRRSGPRHLQHGNGVARTSWASRQVGRFRPSLRGIIQVDTMYIFE